MEHHFTGVETMVETFHSKYTQAANDLGEKKPANPIGGGTSKETRELHGVTLTWNGLAWRGAGKNFELEIGPECDEADVDHWMEQFKPIRERVLIRPFEMIPCHKFLIGKNANAIHNHCVAFAKGNLIGCPVTEKGHIIAIKTAEASQTTPDLLPVDFSTILLHEIGHTLKRQFPDLRQAVAAEMIANGPMAWHLMECLTKIISPHYLAEQHPAVLTNMGFIHIKNFTEPTRHERTKELKWCDQIAGEIFAETCRYFYLDAVIEGKSRPEIKTGSEPIDNLIHTMCEQAKLTLAKCGKQIPYDGLEVDGPDLV
jgi:hypothetical protein